MILCFLKFLTICVDNQKSIFRMQIKKCCYKCSFFLILCFEDFYLIYDERFFTFSETLSIVGLQLERAVGKILKLESFSKSEAPNSCIFYKSKVGKFYVGKIFLVFIGQKQILIVSTRKNMSLPQAFCFKVETPHTIVGNQKQRSSI